MIDTKIEQVIQEKIRPALQMHGGDMEVLGYENGELRFRMLGACAGCAAADETTAQLIEEECRKHLPGFKKAILDDSVSEDLLAQAREILRRGREQQER